MPPINNVTTGGRPHAKPTSTASLLSTVNFKKTNGLKTLEVLPSIEATLEPHGIEEDMRRKFCVELLMNGCPVAYEHLFNLTTINKALGCDADKMRVLQQKLVQVETAQKNNDIISSFMNLRFLGGYFESKGDFLESEILHTLALDFVLNPLNAPGIFTSDQIAEAYHSQGHVREVRGRVDLALESFHKMHEFALKGCKSGTDLSPVFVSCCTQMIQLLTKQADKFETEKQFDLAIEPLTRALEFAQVGCLMDLVRMAQFRLGLLMHNLENIPAAINFLELYMDGVKAKNDKFYHRACAILADSHFLQGDTVLAIAFLEQLVMSAKEAGEQRMSVDACSRLGQINSAKNNHPVAIAWLERAYEGSRTLGDPELAMRCQIDLGVARAAAVKDSYELCLKNVTQETCLLRLLSWKEARDNTFFNIQPKAPPTSNPEAGVEEVILVENNTPGPSLPSTPFTA